MTTAADLLGRRVAPLSRIDPARNDVLDALIAAMAAPAQPYEDVFRDGPGYVAGEPLLDPALTPAILLPWLAQFPGVELPPGSDEQTQRALIAEAAGLNRGQTRSIESAVRRTLSVPDGFVLVIAQASGDRWAMEVITRTSQTPDPTASEAAAQAQKPVGVVMTFLTSDAPFIDEGTAVIDTVTATIDAATVADVS